MLSLLRRSGAWTVVSVWVGVCAFLGASASAQAESDGFRLFGEAYYPSHEAAQSRALQDDDDFFLRIFALPLDSEVQLLRVSSDASPGFSDLKLILNDESAMSQLVYYLDAKNRNGYTPEGLKKGVVLLSAQGRDILRMKGENFDASVGGPLVLDYLYSGVTGSRGHFAMELLRDGTHWSLWVNDRAGRRPFTMMYLPTHQQWPFGVVGIDHVEVK